MRTRWVIFLCLLSIAAAEAPLIYFAYQGEDVQPWITWGLVWYMVALECVVFGALAILFKVLDRQTVSGRNAWSLERDQQMIHTIETKFAVNDEVFVVLTPRKLSTLEPKVIKGTVSMIIFSAVSEEEKVPAKICYKVDGFTVYEENVFVAESEALARASVLSTQRAELMESAKLDTI